MIPTRLLGAIRLRKNGIENDRFIAAPLQMKGVRLSTDAYRTLAEIGGPERLQLEEFLSGYSEDQGNDVAIIGPVEVEDAADLIDNGHRAFRRAN